MDHRLLTLTSLFLLTCGHVAATQINRIRGVPASKSSLYPADRDFQCLDGSLFIPFSRVNDDYCDCADGSDEPGTAACSNGSFFCLNAGHQATYVPSSRVNDGVCDCCDTSDEYASNAKCRDTCHELGREARIEAQRVAELAKEGNKIRQDLLARGKLIKGELQTELLKRRTEYEEAERMRTEKETMKNKLEEMEKAALAKYKPAENEEAAKELEEGEEEEELSENEARDYFKMLDGDNSGTITIVELQSRATFDKDRDGMVSEEEAKYFLDNREEVTLQEFLDSSWSNVKPFIMREQGVFKPSHADSENPDQETADAHSSAEDEDLERAEGEEQQAEEHTSDVEEEPEVQYDEETQSLINQADNAREQFKEAEKSARDLQAEIRKLEDKIDRDYGPEEEFASLDGECFEYTDLEYIYSLCLFGKSEQKSKSGGSAVTLGHWNEWVGPEGNKYSAMKYDRGLTCWNGPARSVMVTLTCGKENALLSVAEPSRCEYTMELSTPALCKPGSGVGDSHDEL